MRAILLVHGKIVEEGAPQNVISAYMELGRETPTVVGTTAAFVSRLVIRGENGPKARFQSGDDAWLDIDVTANQRCDRVSLAVSLRNERNIESFYSSTVRLGVPPVAIDAGETRTFTVHLKLHLASGTFQLGTQVYRYDVNLANKKDGVPTAWEIYDDRFPVGTLLVSSPTDVGGVANLYPELEVSSPVGSKRPLDRCLVPAL